jgi:hypothetical protein
MVDEKKRNLNRSGLDDSYIPSPFQRRRTRPQLLLRRRPTHAPPMAHVAGCVVSELWSLRPQIPHLIIGSARQALRHTPLFVGVGVRVGVGVGTGVSAGLRRLGGLEVPPNRDGSLAAGDGSDGGGGGRK